VRSAAFLPGKANGSDRSTGPRQDAASDRGRPDRVDPIRTNRGHASADAKRVRATPVPPGCTEPALRRLAADLRPG